MTSKPSLRNILATIDELDVFCKGIKTADAHDNLSRRFAGLLEQKVGDCLKTAAEIQAGFAKISTEPQQY